MTEADILALTYQDSCWVYRPQKTTLPSGESVFQKGLDGRQVYENIPCALSSPSGGKLGKKEPTASIDTDFLLFVRPEVEIEPGDTVKVIRLGREYLTEAGLADRQPSHNNVPLKLAVIQIAHELQGKVKEKTPHKTGRLQDSWKVGPIVKKGDTYYIEVYTNVEYAEPVEYGHRTRGGRGFVPGKHMMELSLEELNQALPGFLREWLSDFISTHDL